MPLAQTTIIDQKPIPITPPKRQVACAATSNGRPSAASGMHVEPLRDGAGEGEPAELLPEGVEPEEQEDGQREHAGALPEISRGPEPDVQRAPHLLGLREQVVLEPGQVEDDEQREERRRHGRGHAADWALGGAPRRMQAHWRGSGGSNGVAAILDLRCTCEVSRRHRSFGAKATVGALSAARTGSSDGECVERKSVGVRTLHSAKILPDEIEPVDRDLNHCRVMP